MTNELSAEDAIERIKNLRVYMRITDKDSKYKFLEENYEALDMGIKALEQPRWIPIKTKPLTEEEKEHYISIGWSEDSLEFIYNCPLPDDGQEVLITDSMGNVELDTFYSDDGCYFENNCDPDEVIAWMPKPQPYRENERR